MSRRAEPRITDPENHPRRYVSLRVAAQYLEVDRRTLNVFIAEKLLAPTWFGKQRKVAVAELMAFEKRQLGGRKAG